MKQVWKAGVPGLVLSLALALGCSRQVGELASNRNAATGRQLPFDRASDDKGISPTSRLVSAEVPVGTPITIRLQAALSSAQCRAGDLFQAVLDEPIMVEGQTLLPRGASVRGRIVAAKAAGEWHDPGYLRLTLSSLSINGRTLPLQSSSIFAKGSSRAKPNRPAAGGSVDLGDATGEAAPGAQEAMVEAATQRASGTGMRSRGNDVRFSTEQRLTFRLVQPLSLGADT